MTNKTLFWPFYVSFCTFCASLWLTRTVFSWLLKKAILMALWTKAIFCVKSSLLEQSLPRTQSRLTTNQRQSAKSAFRIRVNPWLINDLRLFKALYNCRDASTDVMSALQIRLFMQNKANFRKSQMNVTKVLTNAYDKRTLGELGKNKPNTKPNEPN
jgi:hypothetical protein